MDCVLGGQWKFSSTLNEIISTEGGNVVDSFARARLLPGFGPTAILPLHSGVVEKTQKMGRKDILVN
jgi:hypothetical protein